MFILSANKQQVKLIIRIFKWLLAITMILFLTLFLVGFMLSSDLPEGKKGEQADLLAKKMLTAVNQEAWDTTYYLQWSFRGGHDYVWDRKDRRVEVKWAKNRVILDLANWENGKAFKNEKVMQNKDRDKLIDKAWGFFCNDSFWVIAPTKVMEEVVERRLVMTKEGNEALLVTYKSGGTTPGDSYLWHLDEDGLPNSYQMWVSIIPIGGVKATWEDWETTSTGLKVATKHKLGPLNVAISNLKTAHTLEALNLDRNPFK